MIWRRCSPARGSIAALLYPLNHLTQSMTSYSGLVQAHDAPQLKDARDTHDLKQFCRVPYME